MGEAMSRRIRGLFNAANFWAIILYNVLALNSFDFAKLVANRLIFKGRGWGNNAKARRKKKNFQQQLPKVAESPGTLSLEIHVVSHCLLRVFCHMAGLSKPLKAQKATEFLSSHTYPLCFSFPLFSLLTLSSLCVVLISC